MKKELTEEQKEASKLYNREYRKKNLERLKEQQKIYRENNKEKIKLTNQQYRENNREELLIKEAKKRNENKDEINRKHREYLKNPLAKEKKNLRDKNYVKNNREKINKQKQERRKNDENYKINCVIRTSINNSFRRNGYKKNTKTFEILGCTWEEFKLHLESKFEPWMTWENRGLYNGELNYGWDVDHIIPSDTAKTEDDVIRLNHYTNLQPLCSKMNRDIKRNFLGLF